MLGLRVERDVVGVREDAGVVLLSLAGVESSGSCSDLREGVFTPFSAPAAWLTRLKNLSDSPSDWEADTSADTATNL